MALQLYNTLTRKKESFHSLNDNEVRMYSCGPTVYNYAHLGNLRAYVFTDVLKRVLVYNGFKVKHVMNITDVGHLTDDADAGEDKMEKGARREGKTVWDIAAFYTSAFKQDISRLNIIEPSVWCKATEHIADMISVIKKLEKNGYTYLGDGNVYFDTSKFKHYAELGRLKLDELESGARTDVDEAKKHPRDFVLWFGLGKSKFGSEHAMKWESPWGIGYPGWHIECTAMSSKYLGEQFDIHTGGIDHIPVHHTNEIAQAEGAFGKHPWVQFWLHNNFLVVDKDKMAKSGDNFLRMQTVLDKRYDPLAYRYFCLGSHYRSELGFSWEAMDGALNAYNRFKNKIIELKKNLNEIGATDVNDYLWQFEKAINDDMNMPVALATSLELLNDTSISSKTRYETLLKFDAVLGFNIESLKEEQIELSNEIESLVQKREEARKKKDFKTADKIRDELKAKGILLEDSATGVVWKKI
jgi:cysteinyl-tRNA synthetase